MREVDDAVRRHVVAILRIVARFAALLGDRPSVTRRLRRIVLSTLHPVESAARRIVIYAAARVPITVRERADPPKRKPRVPLYPASVRAASSCRSIAGARSPVAAPRDPSVTGAGTATFPASISLDPAGVILHYSPFPVRRRHRRNWRPHQAGPGRCTPNPVLPLFDALRRVRRAARRQPVPQHAVPRISIAGVTPWQCLPPPASPRDQFDSEPLRRRIAAVQAALAELPSQARRFARWRARQDMELARRKAGAAAHGPQHFPTREEMQLNRKCVGPLPEPIRYRRFHALRTARPPGCRLIRYDPAGRRPPDTREIDEILAHVNALAWEAWEIRARRQLANRENPAGDMRLPVSRSSAPSLPSRPGTPPAPCR